MRRTSLAAIVLLRRRCDPLDARQGVLAATLARYQPRDPRLQTAKRAREVACAGGDNILMIGTPHPDKTMLARRPFRPPGRVRAR